MKALLLDANTMKVVSMVYSQTQILEKEVYLVERLGKNKSQQSMNHMKAAIFVQPTEANFELIARELAAGTYKEYHLFFSNVVPADMLARLARLDENDLVQQVQEYYADYMVINEDFFHLSVDNSLQLSSNLRTLESGVVLEKNVNGLLSVLLSLKKIPSQIRYQSSSELARRLSSEVLAAIEKGEPFDYRRQDGVLLLVLDRRDDPVTPLLTQWTYQSMVHELLTLSNNRVDLSGVANISPELKEVVLSATQDDFFRRHRYANFGDLGEAVKKMLDEYQKVSKKNENINSIEDMQNFLERFPDFRSKSINVSKHVAVIGQLSHLTDARQLLQISEVEQEIVCSNDRNTHKTDVLTAIRNTKVRSEEKLRMAILYCLRYESYDDMREIKQTMASAGVPANDIRALDAILDYAGESKRAPGLFGGGIFSKLTKTFSAVGGAQNVYTQHQPVLLGILQNILNGKLKDSAFPPLTTSGGTGGAFRPTEVIVFMVGGATFEEAYRVAEFNAANPTMKVILGGSCVQNSKSFLNEVKTVFGR